MMNAAQVHKGVRKLGAGKGRQVEDQPLQEVRCILVNQPSRSALLIEFLHIIQDTFRCSSDAESHPLDYKHFTKEVGHE